MVSQKGCFVLLAWISIGLGSVLYAAHYDNCRTIELLPHIRDKALKSYVIRTVQVPREDVCEISCYQEPNCMSYNYDPTKQSCDLNNRSHEQVSSDDLVSNYGSVHRSFLNSCHGVTCPVNVTACQVRFTNKGYRCACREGYEATGDHGRCEDIDECHTGSHDCSPFATCNNVPGSFRCSCNSRFTGDGKTCRDIDECLSSPCNNGGTCINRDGGFECSCRDEWTGTYCETGRIIICEKNEKEIKCSGERKIKVLFANYGRLDNHTCPGPGQNKDTDCRYDMSEDRVRNHCQGQPSCIITSSKSFFDNQDPCGGIFKYLLMEYRCEN